MITVTIISSKAFSGQCPLLRGFNGLVLLNSELSRHYFLRRFPLPAIFAGNALAVKRRSGYFPPTHHFSTIFPARHSTLSRSDDSSLIHRAGNSTRIDLNLTSRIRPRHGVALSCALCRIRYTCSAARCSHFWPSQ